MGISPSCEALDGVLYGVYGVAVGMPESRGLVLVAACDLYQANRIIFSGMYGRVFLEYSRGE